VADPMRDTGESLGDVLVSRENLRKEAMGTVGRLQALVEFLRDREDLSRDRLADMAEEDWRKLDAAAEATPSPYGPNGRPTQQEPNSRGKGESETTSDSSTEGKEG
jgi:hypothetical protein